MTPLTERKIDDFLLYALDEMIFEKESEKEAHDQIYILNLLIRVRNFIGEHPGKIIIGITSMTSLYFSVKTYRSFNFRPSDPLMFHIFSAILYHFGNLVL